MPIFLRSFLTTSLHFCRGRPGLLLKPSGSHVRACRGSLWWSICKRCPSHLRRLHLIMSSRFGSAVASLTFSFVTLSFQEIPRILRCHLWCAASSFFSFWWLRLATALHCWATWRGLVLHEALFSLATGPVAAAKILSTIPISGLWSGLAPKSNGLLPVRHPAPRKVVKNFRLLFELTGNYALNFPIPHGKKSFKKIPRLASGWLTNFNDDFFVQR